MANIVVHFKNTPEGEVHHIPIPPKAEFKVLEFLGDNEMTGPQISRASRDAIKISAVYKLLGRLKDRGLVTSRIVMIEVTDIQIKRVVYTKSYDKEFN